VKQVTAIMQEISIASREQSIGVDQVNQAIAHMDQVTQQNAALVEEAAAAATRLAEEAASLSQAVSLFNFGKMPPPRRVAMPGGKSGAANTGKPAALKRLAA
ncbi:MAG: chemotaxis protein, partial [Janthinobacterium sp.]